MYIYLYLLFADLAKKHPEIQNLDLLVSSLTDARIGTYLGFILRQGSLGNVTPQSYKSNAVPPPQTFGLVGCVLISRFFFTKINYFSSIQCCILTLSWDMTSSFGGHLSFESTALDTSQLKWSSLSNHQALDCFRLCESHIIRQENYYESRMIQVSTIVVSLHYSKSSEESNR